MKKFVVLALAAAGLLALAATAQAKEITTPQGVRRLRLHHDQRP